MLALRDSYRFKHNNGWNKLNLDAVVPQVDAVVPQVGEDLGC